MTIAPSIGPWHVVTDGEIHRIYSADKRDGPWNRVATTHGNVADARLIAAAPDLLWLVQSWVQWPDDDPGRPASIAARRKKAIELLASLDAEGA